MYIKLSRYWNLHARESSREIHRMVPAKVMRVAYPMYHTMGPEMAIDRLKEIHSRSRK